MPPSPTPSFIAYQSITRVRPQHDPEEGQTDGAQLLTELNPHQKNFRDVASM